MFDKSSVQAKVLLCAVVFVCILYKTGVFALEETKTNIIEPDIQKKEEKSLHENAQKNNDVKEVKKDSSKLVKAEKTVQQSDDSITVVHNEKKDASNEISAQKNTSVVVVEKTKPRVRTLTISNEITDDMITYKKHWTGHHSPSKFVVTVNNQEIKKGGQTTIEVKDDLIEVAYNYEFRALGRVQRAGGRKFEYKVPQEVDKITSTFSWDAHHNLILDKGQLISSVEIG